MDMNPFQTGDDESPNVHVMNESPNKRVVGHQGDIAVVKGINGINVYLHKDKTKSDRWSIFRTISGFGYGTVVGNKAPTVIEHVGEWQVLNGSLHPSGFEYNVHVNDMGFTYEGPSLMEARTIYAAVGSVYTNKKETAIYEFALFKNGHPNIPKMTMTLRAQDIQSATIMIVDVPTDGDVWELKVRCLNNIVDVIVSDIVLVMN